MFRLTNDILSAFLNLNQVEVNLSFKSSILLIIKTLGEVKLCNANVSFSLPFLHPFCFFNTHTHLLYLDWEKYRFHSDLLPNGFNE